MKSIYLIILNISLLLFLSNCKKDNDEQASQPGGTFEKLSTVINVSGEAAQVFQDNFFQDYDTLRAFHAVGNFLSEHDQVASGYYVDRNRIEFTLKNGLSSSILFMETDANGNHKYRGGGGSATLKSFSSQNKTVKIKNEKVLVLNPYISHFAYPNHSYDSYLPYFEGGDVQLKVTHIDENDVRLSHINSMDEYGMVILNTHGSFGNFNLYDLVTLSHPEAQDFKSDDVEELLKKADNYPMEKFENGELQMTSAFKYNEKKNKKNIIEIFICLEVTANYIRNSNLDLTNVVVFGNYCYSGHKNPFRPEEDMVEAWQSKNVGTYYGYAFDNGMSTTANDDFCRQVEITLIKRLAQDNDTTGVAHLSSDGKPQSQANLADSTLFGMNINTEKDFLKFHRMLRRNRGPYQYPLYLTKFFSGNLKWGCPDSIFTDPRDGEVYKIVCIGDQVWMAENLRYAGAGVCYDNNAGNCTTYGRLYSIKETTGLTVSNTNPGGVQGICPNGWHVPSSEEWAELFAFSGGYLTKLRATTLWPPNQNKNELGFSALPGGRYVEVDTLKSFENIGDQAYFWTSSKSKDGQFYLGAIIGAGLSSSYNANFEPPSKAERFFSCRCVKD